jgi:hypothetical protein
MLTVFISRSLEMSLYVHCPGVTISTPEIHTIEDNGTIWATKRSVMRLALGVMY